MATYKLAELGEWAEKTELRMEAVIKTSLQDLSEEVQRKRAKGGRMPVDTGFLANSAGAALNTVPASDGSYEYNQGTTSLIINRLRIGDTFYFGWSANYAKYMNHRYGFLDLPVQDWNNIVIRAIRKVGG